MNISTAEWHRRIELLREGYEAAKMVSTASMTLHEQGDYETLICNAVELLDEQYPPHYAIMDTHEDSQKNIRQIFSNIKCKELRRVLIRMNPADALMLADTVIRSGNQWKFRQEA